MSAESFHDAALSKLAAGPLLDQIDLTLKAGNVIEGGEPGGLIASLDYRPQGRYAQGMAPYNSGTDQELDIRATIANKEPLAVKRPGLSHPRKLHVLTEWDQRYLGATGYNSLQTLSRLTVATALIAAETARVPAQLITTSSGNRPKVVDDNLLEAEDSLHEYDQNIQEIRKRRPRRQLLTALTDGLKELTESEYGLRPQSDVALVVSDFLMGAKRDRSGNVVSFDWQEPLTYLSEMLGDRLFVIQLTSPAQRELPDATRLTDGTRSYEMDQGERLKSAVGFAAGAQQKAERIAHAMQGLRHIQLDSANRTPFLDLTDFVFGPSPEA